MKPAIFHSRDSPFGAGLAVQASLGTKNNSPNMFPFPCVGYRQDSNMQRGKESLELRWSAEVEPHESVTDVQQYKSLFVEDVFEAPEIQAPRIRRLPTPSFDELGGEVDPNVMFGSLPNLGDYCSPNNKTSHNQVDRVPDSADKATKPGPRCSRHKYPIATPHPKPQSILHIQYGIEPYDDNLQQPLGPYNLHAGMHGVNSQHWIFGAQPQGTGDWVVGQERTGNPMAGDWWRKTLKNCGSE